jgi:Spy/CpxP family protein refolding chaperone
MRNRLIGFFGALAAATCLMAQTGQGTRTPPTPEEIATARVARLTRLLELTTAQQESAKKIFTDEAVALAAARTAFATAREAMRNAVRNTGLAADIDRAAAQLGAAHTQIAAAEGKAQAAFRALLTADQRAKLDELRDDRGGPGRRGGPGPMPRRRGGV